MTRIKGQGFFLITPMRIWRESFTVISGEERMSLQSEEEKEGIFLSVQQGGTIHYVRKRGMRRLFAMRIVSISHGSRWSYG